MSSCRSHAYSALHAVDIIEPEDLREEMRSRLKAVTKLYRK